MGCLSPVDVKRPDWAVFRKYMAVPCGRCVGCKLERRRNWTIRIMHEAQMHLENCFLTLTYRDADLVYGARQATLVKTDLQKFWKRLRKELKKNVRYFACGEYGEQRSRPHYHACLFGADFEDKAVHSVSGDIVLYTSSRLDGIWNHGHCTVGALTPGTAAYTAGYILDKKLGKERVYYDAQGIEPEFLVMSRGGRSGRGIGSGWFDKYAGDVYPADRVVLEGGSKTRPPRYYDNLRKEQFPEEMEVLKAERLKKMEETPMEERLSLRMMQKIKFQEARVKTFSKKLHD